MTNGEREIGRTMEKTDSLDSRVERIEERVNEIYKIVYTWKGMAIAYGVIASILVTIAIKLIFG